MKDAAKDLAPLTAAIAHYALFESQIEYRNGLAVLVMNYEFDIFTALGMISHYLRSAPDASLLLPKQPRRKGRKVGITAREWCERHPAAD
jgi:hypothetical protein